MIDKTAMHDIFGPILVGLSTAIAPELAHAYIYSADNIKYGVVCDKQHRIISPTQKDLNDIWDQVRKMGIRPKSIEIIVPGKSPLIYKA